MKKLNKYQYIKRLEVDLKVKPLSKKLAKTSTCVKSYDEKTKWVYLLIENDKSLEKYNTI